MKLNSRFCKVVAVSAVIGATSQFLPTLKAGVLFPDPGGGWAYTYDGSSAAYGGAGAAGTNAGAGKAALDGNWTHDNGSDSWAPTADATDAGDPVGSGLAGGVSLASEADVPSPGGTVNYLRIMDSVNAGSTDVNRRYYFMRDLVPLTGYTATFMDTGITLSFRARLTPDGALELGNGLTAANKGGTVGGDGKGMFGFRQATDDRIATFTLHTASPGEDGGPLPAFAGAGLTMNKNVGDGPGSSNVVGNASTPASLQNDLPIDVNQWHEFWITVAANDATAGNGTHTANIYVDGSLVPTSFNFTSGNGDDTGQLPVGTTTNYLQLGHNFTGLYASVDVDFVSVAFGVIPPVAVPEPSSIALAGLGIVGLVIAGRRRLGK